MVVEAVPNQEARHRLLLLHQPRSIVLGETTMKTKPSDIALPKSHPFSDVYVYDTIERQWYNKQTDIFLSKDDERFYNLPIMDPQEALRNLLEAIHDGERLQTLEALDALNEWIKNGGVFPVIRKDAIDLTPVTSQTIYFVPKVS